MRIRNAHDHDLAAILALQGRTPQAAQWMQADYARLCSDPLGLVLVADLDATSAPPLAGFAAFHRVIDEAELRNIAVEPAYQRRGVGRKLLAEGRRQLLDCGVTRIYLEVRASNFAAQQLYFSAGFSLHSTRKDYYRDPLEDALVLSWARHDP